jgi:ribonuclease HI
MMPGKVKKQNLKCKQVCPTKLSRPCPGWTKLNVDGSWVSEDVSGGAGMILHDDQGQIIFSACRLLEGCDSPLEAELKACVEGLYLAMQWTDRPILQPILQECDCLEAVQMINDDVVNRSKMAGLVNEVKSYCRSSRVRKVTHISREINCVSHNLAQLSRALSCSKIWIRSGPDEIRLACNQDDTLVP